MTKKISKGYTSFLVMILVLSFFSPLIASAATWNGVSGVSDAVVNSISQYENEAASYNGAIETLNWQIQQNQNAIATAQGMISSVQNAKPGDVLHGQSTAQWTDMINNNQGPMNQRIAERSRLQGAQNQAYANANAARGQADAEAAAILAAQNQPKPPVTNPGGNNSGNNNGGQTTPPAESEVPVQPETPTAPSESKPEETKPSEKDPEKDKDKEKEPVKDPETIEEAEEIIKDKENQEVIKDELDDFDHDKTVNELIEENKDGSYSVSEDAVKRAILDEINRYRFLNGLQPVKNSDELVDYGASKAEDMKINSEKGVSGHSNSKKSNELLGLLENNFLADVQGGYVVDDLAAFQSAFQEETHDSADDAEWTAKQIANSIVGEYGGFMSDDHAYDLLNPFAMFASIALTSKQVDYTDAWTGEIKQTTVWYLAYVFTAHPDK